MRDPAIERAESTLPQEVQDDRAWYRYTDSPPPSRCRVCHCEIITWTSSPPAYQRVVFVDGVSTIVFTCSAHYCREIVNRLQ